MVYYYTIIYWCTISWCARAPGTTPPPARAASPCRGGKRRGRLPPGTLHHGGVAVLAGGPEGVDGTYWSTWSRK